MQSALCTNCGMSQTDIKSQLDSITSQTRGPWWGIAKKMVTDYLLFNFFITFSTLTYGQKSTRLNKIYISTRKSSLSEGIFIPVWINTLVHILLDTMYDSPVWFTMLANIIYYNPIPYMVVSFFRSSILTIKMSREL